MKPKLKKSDKYVQYEKVCSVILGYKSRNEVEDFISICVKNGCDPEIVDEIFRIELGIGGEEYVNHIKNILPVLILSN